LSQQLIAVLVLGRVSEFKRSKIEVEQVLMVGKGYGCLASNIVGLVVHLQTDDSSWGHVLVILQAVGVEHIDAKTSSKNHAAILGFQVASGDKLIVL
jgi:hypothetical protein